MSQVLRTSVSGNRIMFKLNVDFTAPYMNIYLLLLQKYYILFISHYYLVSVNELYKIGLLELLFLRICVCESVYAYALIYTTHSILSFAD